MNRKGPLARRLREIREFLYGENGLDALAHALGIPAATWLNYERGAVMPADVLLDLIEVTRVDPHWLRTGEGERLIMETRSRYSNWLRQSDLRTL